MPDYRRYYLSGLPVFITSVTYKRERIFSHPENCDLLWKVTREVQKNKPFDLLAYVVMPDHFHWLIVLPESRPNFSEIMQKIKWTFTLEYKQMHKINDPVKIWQRGFWDHVIRNEDDLAKHLDYIHWNPVKHGLAEKPEGWRESSFSSWIEKGYYEKGWGSEKDIKRIEKLNFE